MCWYDVYGMDLARKGDDMMYLWGTEYIRSIEFIFFGMG